MSHNEGIDYGLFLSSMSSGNWVQPAVSQPDGHFEFPDIFYVQGWFGLDFDRLGCTWANKLDIDVAIPKLKMLVNPSICFKAKVCRQCLVFSTFELIVCAILKVFDL